MHKIALFENLSCLLNIKLKNK